MSHLKSAILALAAVAVPFTAAAVTTDWGQHDPLEVGVALPATGSFEDIYMFGLVEDLAAMSTAVSNNLGTLLQIDGGMVTLYRETGAVDTSVGAFAFDDSTGSISYDFGSLSAGDYYYAVSGMASGSVGGYYTISSAVSPIPEPESLALMLAGLGAAGLLLRRNAQAR